VLRQPQRNLTKLPAIQTFLEPAKPTLGVDYVVFVTASTTHAGGTYVRMGRSNATALAALQDANTVLSPVSKIFKWFQIDYIIGFQRLINFDYNLPFSQGFGEWFGLGLNWEEEIAFLPNQVRAHNFIDSGNYLRWERLALWMHHHNIARLGKMVPDYSDDNTFVEQIDLFRTKSMFIDMSDAHHHHSAAPVVHLDHGHQVFYDSKLTPHQLRQAAIMAGSI
jgi:hypothetical protein